MQQLHWAELPTALLTQTYVRAHSEAKAPPLAEFCFFRQQQPGDRPPSEAGAAMLELLRLDQFPGFALAFYEPLEAAGKDHAAPRLLALVADDAILLAPAAATGGWRGFLIAEGTATGQAREFRWPGDQQPPVTLTVPAPASGSVGAVWAEEAAFLSTRPFPDTPGSPESQPR
jgi:hypothetical protein